MARHRRFKTTHGLSPITEIGRGVAGSPGATWIGQVDEAELSGIGPLPLADADEFDRARLLVWSDDQARGFIELPVVSGGVDIELARSQAQLLPPVPTRRPDGELPPMSVVVCTRNRPDHLHDVLENLIRLGYPEFEVLIVDNDPASGLTAPVVDAFRKLSHVAVRTVDAVGQGLSIARNIALKSAAYDIVAFTDDDVVVDDWWLHNLAYGFSRHETVACVCGIVPSAELITPAQLYFDRRVGWARRCEPAVYRLDDPPAGDPLFPMRVGQFGTGANFAVKRSAVIELGGFDEGLGVGSPAGGGEDIDIFVRILLAGHALVREPSAVVWHRHRRTVAELELQVFNYGLGLGAWIAKLGSRPRTLAMAARRTLPAVKHLRHVTVVEPSDSAADPVVDALYGRELQGVMRGPAALLAARFAGRSARPLARSPKLLRSFDYRRNQQWGDPGNSIPAGRFALAAVILGLVGSLGAVTALPTYLLSILVGAYVLAGPGSLAMSWYATLPPSVMFPVLPAVSLASCIIVVTGLLMLGFYSPIVVLLGMTALTVVGGLARCRYLAARPEVEKS